MRYRRKNLNLLQIYSNYIVQLWNKLHFGRKTNPTTKT